MRRRTAARQGIAVALAATLAAPLMPAGGPGSAPPARAADPPRPGAGGMLRSPERADVPGSAAPTVPTGFRDELLFGGLDRPTVVQFAANGKIFVAEKSGIIKVYDSLSDTTPTQFADLRVNVHDYWDRGLLGMALDPGFTAGRPYVYVLYSANDRLGDGLPAPRWEEPCESPPGGNTDGCVISTRLSRLTANGNVMTGSELVLVQDWCQQFASHSAGTLAFGPEGALYATGGEGAYFFDVDYGQMGGTLPNSSDPTIPRNPCGDPPGGSGGPMTPPTAEGGSLRSQDLRTTGDPVGLNGTLIRIDPNTGAAWPTNNLIGNPDPKARMIVAYGLRNPFRYAIRPGTSEVWIGDVGYYLWEEINEVPDPTAAPRNYGWPCYEGAGPMRDFMDVGLNLCTSLASGSVTKPTFAYQHGSVVTSGDPCGTGSSAIAGVAFLGTTGGFPDSYDRALFFTDYNRRCIWYLPADSAGRPRATQPTFFADLRRPSPEVSGGAVYLGVTPGGDLAYADYDRGEVRRIAYYGGAPTARFTAAPKAGGPPYVIDFDGSGSSDPNPGDILSFAWDLDGDGAYDDSTAVKPSRSYSSTNAVVVSLRVTDLSGLSDTESQTFHPGNTPPTVSITAPGASATWSVGQSIAFQATGSDAQDGTLPASAFAWRISMEHCPSDCHSHIIATPSGTSGSFTAPDHEYPTSLRFGVTVTDSGGLSTTATRDLQPATATTSVASSPTGIPLTLGAATGTPPPAVTTVAGSHVAVSAPATWTIGTTSYAFVSWSDGGARAHDAPTPAGSRTLTATYQAQTFVDESDTCAGAPAPTAPSGRWEGGQFGRTGDVDWHRFSMTGTQNVRIILGNQATNGRLELYRGCTTRIATVDRSGTTVEEMIVRLTAGSYAIRLSGSGTPDSPAYSWLVKRLPASVFVMTSRSIVSGSSLRLVGELYNNTSSTRGPITVTARLLNAGGAVLATRSVTADLPWLPVHGRSPFRIVGSLPAGYARATFTVSAPGTSARIVKPAVTILSSAADAAGHWTVSGRLKNGAYRIGSLRAAVTAYDNRSEIVDSVRAGVGATGLAPNASTWFAGTFPTAGYVPVRIAVWTYAAR